MNRRIKCNSIQNSDSETAKGGEIIVQPNRVDPDNKKTASSTTDCFTQENSLSFSKDLNIARYGILYKGGVCYPFYDFTILH
jgi:hypothetical protein